jgi:murein DD-endopeptidase MepM/ murein hydrolase activator NlpD
LTGFGGGGGLKLRAHGRIVRFGGRVKYGISSAGRQLAAGVLVAFAPPTRRKRRWRPLCIRILAASGVGAVVVALPLGALPAQSAPVNAASVDELAVAPAFMSGGTPYGALRQQRLPLTVTRDGPPEVRTYTVQEGDTLLTIAAHYGVRLETVAYNNKITDPAALHIGDELRIPPMDAAVYSVQPGDTVESVAAKFKVDSKVIMETNRLYFEPDNFAAGKAVLVPVGDSDYPDFQLRPSAPVRADLVARGAPTGAVIRVVGRRLAWPVAGVITQYFWYRHTGVDIAAPYGAGIGAADDGTVSAVGWVAVGGLRVCVRHDWGMETCYYHTGATYVSVGQRVAKGHIIASIGLTGVTTGPHVHWEAKLNGVLVNPLAY